MHSLKGTTMSQNAAGAGSRGIRRALWIGVLAVTTFGAVRWFVRMEARREAYATLYHRMYNLGAPSDEWRAVKWLREWLTGNRSDSRFLYLFGVHSVSLHHTVDWQELAPGGGTVLVRHPSNPDEDLRLLQLLPEVKWVFLEHERLTAGAVRHLASLPNLELLDITRDLRGEEAMADAADWDETARALARCRTLQEVRLRHIPLTEDGLKAFAELPRLEGLELEAIPVTGHAFKDASWKSAATLRYLEIYDCQDLNDEALQKGLRQFHNLRRITIEHAAYEVFRE